MGGFICRFCNSDSENDNGSISLEISTGNRKIIVYVCRTCYSLLALHAIIRCRYCGNIWMQKDGMPGTGIRNVPCCSLCKGEFQEAAVAKERRCA